LKQFSSEVEEKSVVEVDWADRWQVYQRLQELEIPCWCEANLIGKAVIRILNGWLQYVSLNYSDLL